MQTATFTFAGINGTAMRSIKDTFVIWGGMSFQIEAAKPELRAVIDKALADVAEAARQANRRTYMGSLSRQARKDQYL